MARLAMTSLAFMFRLVPAPPWMGSTMNASWSRPAAISSQARTRASATRLSSRPISRLVMAEAFLISAMELICSGCTASPVMGKFSAARRDWTP